MTPKIKSKPTLLKRPDGSLISEPKEWEEIFRLTPEPNCKFELYSTLYNWDLKSEIMDGLIFLKEDRHLAKKKAQQLTKQLEIQYEIDRMNAEEGWVADWSDYTQHKFFFQDDKYGKNGVTIISTVYYNKGILTMSKTTAETILAKYPQDELKQYLGMII